MRDTGDRHYTTAYADNSRSRYVTLYALQAVLQLREGGVFAEVSGLYLYQPLSQKKHDGSTHACLLEPLANGRYPVRDIRRRGSDGLDGARLVAEALGRAFDGAFVGVAGGREGRSQGVCTVEFSVYVTFAGGGREGMGRRLGEPRATIDYRLIAHRWQLQLQPQRRMGLEPEWLALACAGENYAERSQWEFWGEGG